MDDVERRASLDSWFRAYGDRVLAYLLHRTDAETAQDVLQEVFVTAYRRADDVPLPPIGWLLGCARRQLANQRRGALRRDRLTLRLAAEPPRAGGPDETAQDAVRTALAQLTAADQEVLTLSAWYDLTAEDAALALGCSRATYRVRLHRARHRLADRLRASGYVHAASTAEATHD